MVCKVVLNRVTNFNGFNDCYYIYIYIFEFFGYFLDKYEIIRLHDLLLDMHYIFIRYVIDMFVILY